MAYLLESGAKCQQCGTADWEWEEDRFAYEPVSLQCHGCYLKAVAHDDASDVPGTRVALVPKAVATAMREAPKKMRGRL